MTTTTTRETFGRGNTGRRRQDALYVKDIELPPEPLLDARQEAEMGTCIQLCLERMRTLLLRHPAGYRNVLVKLEDVVAGRDWVFSWTKFKDVQADDCRKARSALEWSEKTARDEPEPARSRFMEGQQILAKYRQEPEALIRICRHVLESSENHGELESLLGARRIEPILTKLLWRLEETQEKLIRANLRLVLRDTLRYQPEQHCTSRWSKSTGILWTLTHVALYNSRYGGKWIACVMKSPQATSTQEAGTPVKSRCAFS